MSRLIRLDIDEDDKTELIAVALSSKIRRNILRMLRSRSYTIVEIAETLNVPVSTTAFHIKVLEKARLLFVTLKANSRGNAKVVSRRVDDIAINLLGVAEEGKKIRIETINLPLGSFVKAEVHPGCGIANENSIIVADDLPGCFYSPERFSAQMVWYSKGYIEYNIPNYFCTDKQILSLMVSCEICSEAPNYRNDWKSDITFWINGIEVCTYLSLGDFGGRRGRLNPIWWSDFSTQYGMMKTIEVNADGTFLDEESVSATTIDKLVINSGNYFTLRIGVKENAKNQGGINIFGEKFGDYAQGLMIRVDYLSSL